MGSETSSIPKPIQIDDDTIKKNASGNIYTDKISFLSKNQLAKMKLQIVRNLVSNSLTETTDSYTEISVDADGLRNTIDTGNTTSTYNSTDDAYKNLDIITDDTDSSGYGESWVLIKTWTLPRNISSLDTHKITVGSSQDGSKIYLYYICVFDDDTEESVGSEASPILNNANENATYSLTLPTSNKEIKEIRYYAKAGGFDPYPRVEYFELKGGSVDTEIYFDYDKSKPTQAYIVCFDKDMNVIEGDYTGEFIHTSSSETSGELESLEIVNISMTNTPDRFIIHQKETTATAIQSIVIMVD